MLTCMAHIALIAHLDTNFGERQMITGHDSRGPQIEIYVAPATGTWTLVAMNRKGEACIIASGDNMRIVTDAE